MNILLVSSMSDKTTGGISSWTKEYINYCSQHEISCTLVNTKFVGKRNNQESRFNLFDEYKRNKRILADLSKEIKNNDQYEVAHLNSSCSMMGIFRDLLIAKKIKKKKIKLFVHFHCDVEYQVKLWKKIVRFFSFRTLKKLIQIADGIIALTSNSRNYIKAQFLKDSMVVPNFIHEKVIKKTSEISVNSICSNAAFVGHVIFEKGISEIFQVASRHPDIRFNLVGEVDNNIVKQFGTDNILFLGPLNHDKVIEILDKSDFFILPSHSEGFSVALLEAMARGLPVIATDVGANQEMLSDQGGFISSVGDVDKMSNDVEKIKDSTIRSKMALFNVKKVSANYSDKIVFQQYIGVYKQ